MVGEYVDNNLSYIYKSLRGSFNRTFMFSISKICLKIGYLTFSSMTGHSINSSYMILFGCVSFPSVTPF
jgi:hypothetical protein